MKHYKNLGKRVLSLFVAFVMCVSMLPGMAFALDLHCSLGFHYGKWLEDECVKELSTTFCTISHQHKGTCSKCHETVIHFTTCDHDYYYGSAVDAGNHDSLHTKMCHKCTFRGAVSSHSFSAATCTTPKTCIDCQTQVGSVEPNNHSFTNYVSDNNATCSEDGTKTAKCDYGCDKMNTISDTGSKKDHETLEWFVDEHDGTHQQRCASCKTLVGVAEAHKDDAGVLNEDGTEKVFHCIDCKVETRRESVTTPVEPGECAHNFVLDEKESETDGPACGAKKYVYYCNYCQQRKTEYTGGNAHDPDTNVWVKLNDQKHAHPCLYCEKPLNRYADVVKDHSGWTVVETIAPTCIADGYTIEKCADCEATRKNVVPAAHQWSTELQPKGTDKHGYQCEVCAEWKDLENHNFNQLDNTCICGQKNLKPVEPTEPKCEHQGTLLRWIDNKDGKTHAVLCNGCWTTIDEAAAHAWENDVCKFCHAKKTETPKPDECKHYLNTVPEQAPTCTEDGMKKHLKCSKCGKVFEAGAATAPNPVETTVEALTINKLSHDLTTTVVEATCTSKGSETTTCTRCGYSEKKELPMIAHTRKDVAANAATCTEEGNVAYWTCEVCNKNFTGSGTNSVEITDVTTPALGHDWVEDGKTDSTCSDKGNQHYTCSRCDAVKDEVIDPTGHTPETIAAKTPTCTETGLTEGSKCSVCDAIIEEQETVPALGHDIVTDEAVPATCTGTGLTEGSHCSRCDDAAVAQEVVAALGHDWDNGVVSTAATCDGAGVRTHTCQREGCGETETRAISALGHSAVSYANVAATCTTVGYTGGSYCSRCSAVITARTTVPATGHAWNAGVITTYPTYYSTGLRTYTCATCAATRTETIPQLTYTYDPGYTDPDPDPDPDYQPPVSSNRQPTTTIPDDNTPLGNTPNTPTVTIEDEDTPLANRPLPFIDVASGDWFRPYVSFVYGKGMMTGMSDTLFGPNVSTTRGMIVTIIYRMENASATGVSPFTDVERDEYYADPISWASDNGVVLGYSETLFGPKDNITREQMAAILYRYCVSKGIDVANYGDLSRFPDGDKVSDYAVEAMRWAVDRGLIAGMDDGRLDPTGTATRAQVATILNRFCEMIGA